ncbi:MAG: hypothetical protein KDK99_13055 [Verrucomicrobiales bacterium]|nr:hypothetical protein [Verrucomicrobiales bacterium]
MKYLHFLALIGALATLTSSAAEVEEFLAEPRDEVRDRVVPLRVYATDLDTATAHPIVLFSHGLGGSRNNNAFLGRCWAQAGYIAVFMQHPGSDEAVWRGQGGAAAAMAALKAAANLQASRDRFLDVPFVIDQLEHWNSEQGHPLYQKLDLAHIGMSGHSFGAVTSQGLMGQTFRIGGPYTDPRITAFLLMSPSAHRATSPEQAFQAVTAPVFCMTGTEDGSPVEPDLDPLSRQQVYAALPAGDKYQIVFEGARHMAFGDAQLAARNDRYHAIIEQLSTRFWDAYLKADVHAKAWLQSDQPRTLLQPQDSWSWK